MALEAENELLLVLVCQLLPVAEVELDADSFAQFELVEFLQEESEGLRIGEEEGRLVGEEEGSLTGEVEDLVGLVYPALASFLGEIIQWAGKSACNPKCICEAAQLAAVLTDGGQNQPTPIQ